MRFSAARATVISSVWIFAAIGKVIDRGVGMRAELDTVI